MCTICYILRDCLISYLFTSKGCMSMVDCSMRSAMNMMGQRWYVVYLNFIGNKQPVSVLPPCMRECTPSTFVRVLACKQFLYDTNVHTHKTESKVRLKVVGEIRRKPSYANIRGGLNSKVVCKELELGLTFTSSVMFWRFQHSSSLWPSDAELCLLQVRVSWRDTQVLVILHGKYICQGQLLALTFTNYISSSFLSNQRWDGLSSQDSLTVVKMSSIYVGRPLVGILIMKEAKEVKYFRWNNRNREVRVDGWVKHRTFFLFMSCV